MRGPRSWRRSAPNRSARTTRSCRSAASSARTSWRPTSSGCPVPTTIASGRGSTTSAPASSAATAAGGRSPATHEDAPNNWGSFTGASRIAASLYLGDTADVARAAQVLRGFLGDRSVVGRASRGSKGAKSWACDPDDYTPVNPPCARDGIDLDGAIVRDIDRGGNRKWPPGRDGIGYTLESLQGLSLQAELLTVNGFGDVWTWSDQALQRAAGIVSRSGEAGRPDLESVGGQLPRAVAAQRTLWPRPADGAGRVRSGLRLYGLAVRRLVGTFGPCGPVESGPVAGSTAAWPPGTTPAPATRADRRVAGTIDRLPARPAGCMVAPPPTHGFDGPDPTGTTVHGSSRTAQPNRHTRREAGPQSHGPGIQVAGLPKSHRAPGTLTVPSTSSRPHLPDAQPQAGRTPCGISPSPIARTGSSSIRRPPAPTAPALDAARPAGDATDPPPRPGAHRADADHLRCGPDAAGRRRRSPARGRTSP